MTFMVDDHVDKNPRRQDARTKILYTPTYHGGTVRHMIDDVVKRIEERIAALGSNPEAVSKAAKLSRDTVTKIKSKFGDGLQQGIKLSTIEALAPALGVTPEWLAFGVEAPPAEDAVATARIENRLQAGVWAPAIETAFPDGEVVAIPRRFVPRGAQIYAAEVVGSSMNRIYPEGSIVVLERRIGDRRSDLAQGGRYHVERIKPDGSVEHTLKTMRRSADGSIWLVPESDDPAFQAPLPFRDAAGEHVAVAGRVLVALVPG